MGVSSARAVGEEVYEAADALLRIAARRASSMDLEALAGVLEKLPLLARLLERLDEETVDALARLLDVLGSVAKQYGPCVEEAVRREPEQISGLKGILSVLRDEEAMRGLSILVEILRGLGRCGRA